MNLQTNSSASQPKASLCSCRLAHGESVYQCTYPQGPHRVPLLPFGVTPTPTPGEHRLFSIFECCPVCVGGILTEHHSLRPVLLVCSLYPSSLSIFHSLEGTPFL